MRFSQYKKLCLLLSKHLLTYAFVWVEFESMISLRAVLNCKLAYDTKILIGFVNSLFRIWLHPYAI